MRPIENAAAPMSNGVAKTYTDYKDWRRDLENAYGLHCVYCNDRLSYNIQVEHLSAQALGIVNPLQWNNLFLACGPCNLAKTNTIVTPNTHYLPNAHNTHMAFQYTLRPHRNLTGKMACVVEPNATLNLAQRTKAQTTIDDFKLDLVEQDPGRERKMTDVRWQNRFDAFNLTLQQRSLWNMLATPQQKSAFLTAIPPQVVKVGYFSLWINAFDQVPEALNVIINTLPNTAINCFDSAGGYLSIPRNPGQVDPI